MPSTLEERLRGSNIFDVIPGCIPDFVECIPQHIPVWCETWEERPGPHFTPSIEAPPPPVVGVDLRKFWWLWRRWLWLEGVRQVVET